MPDSWLFIIFYHNLIWYTLTFHYFSWPESIAIIRTLQIVRRRKQYVWPMAAIRLVSHWNRRNRPENIGYFFWMVMFRLDDLSGAIQMDSDFYEDFPRDFDTSKISIINLDHISKIFWNDRNDRNDRNDIGTFKISIDYFHYLHINHAAFATTLPPFATSQGPGRRTGRKWPSSRRRWVL